MIGTYAYYLRKVWVYVLSTKGPLNRYTNRAVRPWSFLSIWPHLMIPFAFSAWNYTELANSLLTLYDRSEGGFEPVTFRAMVKWSNHSSIPATWKSVIENVDISFLFFLQQELDSELDALLENRGSIDAKVESIQQLAWVLTFWLPSWLLTITLSELLRSTLKGYLQGLTRPSAFYPLLVFIIFIIIFAYFAFSIADSSISNTLYKLWIPY